jgi:hypothetical protein
VLNLVFNDKNRISSVRKSPSLCLNPKALKIRASSLLEALSATSLTAAELDRLINNYAEMGLPLKKHNNNFWAKFVLRLETRNPTWDCAKTVSISYDDYKEFLLSSFEDLSKKQCA